MGCLGAAIALVAPRLVMIVLWLFSDYLSNGFGTWVWPLLGFFLLPTTTLGWAIASNEFGGFESWGILIVALGLVLDFGLLAGGTFGGRGMVGRRVAENRNWSRRRPR
jgi:hypothetical protein